MVRTWLVVMTILITVAPVCFSQDARSVTESEDGGGYALSLHGTAGKTGSATVSWGGYDTSSIKRPYAGLGYSLEIGVMGPTPARPADGIFSVDGQSTINLFKGRYEPKRRNYFFFTEVGYTRFFSNGNGLNYGGGILWQNPHSGFEWTGVRVGYREYYLSGWGRQPSVRISWEFGTTEPD